MIMYTKEEIIRMIYLQNNLTGRKEMQNAIDFATSRMLRYNDDVIVKWFNVSTGNKLNRVSNNRFQITF
jgi:hypothetical protein